MLGSGGIAVALFAVDQVFLHRQPSSALAPIGWTLPASLGLYLAVACAVGLVGWWLLARLAPSVGPAATATLTVGFAALAALASAVGMSPRLAAVVMLAVVGGALAFRKVERRDPSVVAALAWLLPAALVAVVASAGWRATASGGDTSGGEGRVGPHVLLVVLDALRRDHVGLYGGASTPGLDRFFAGGVIVDDAIAPSSFTIPSMVGVMTGRLPPIDPRSNQSSLRVERASETLAEAFGRAGYATGAFVANYTITPATGLWRGFGERLLLRHDLRPGELWFAAPLFQQLWNTAVPAPEPRFADTNAAVVRGAASFLERHAAGSAFAWVHLMTPHDPYDPPGDLVKGGYDGRLRPGRFAPGQEDPRINDLRHGRFVLTDADQSHVRALYAAEVRVADAAVTALLDALHARELLSSTVVVVIGDHGEELWDHGGYWHGHALHPELVRVPLLFHIPGASARRVSGAVSMLGLPATLLELAGHSGLTAPDAPSFAPALLRGAPAGDAVFSVLHEQHQVAVVTSDHAAVLSAPSGELRLFDRRADPNATRDVAAALPEIAESLRARAAEVRRTLVDRAGDAAGADPATDDETLRSLRALGYL